MIAATGPASQRTNKALTFNVLRPNTRSFATVVRMSASILVVEDNDVDLWAVKRALSRLAPNCEIVCASTAEEGLLLVGGVSVALVDMGLPGRGGLWFVDEVRRRGIPNLRVILMSGRQLAYPLSRVATGEIAGVIEKHDDWDMFLRVLERTLESVV